jgi:hypothetical protein
MKIDELFWAAEVADELVVHLLGPVDGSMPGFRRGLAKT